MSNNKSSTRNATQGMLLLALLSSLLTGMFGYIGEGSRSLETLALPFGLPDTIGGISFLNFIHNCSIGLTGLALAVMPTNLPRKKILLGGFSLLAITTFLCFFFNSSLQLVGLNILSGIAWTLFSCAWLAIGVAHFPRHGAIVIAGYYFIGEVASFAVNGTMGMIVNHAHWSEWLPAGCVGIVLLIFLRKIILYLFQQASAERLHVVNTKASCAAASLWSPAPLILALATVFMVLAAYPLLMGYLFYLRDEIGFSSKTLELVAKTGMLVSFFSPIGGWLGKRYGSFNILLIVAPITAAFGLLPFFCGNMLFVILPLFFLASLGMNAFLYVNILAASVQSVTPVQCIRILGISYAAIHVLPCFAPSLFISLQHGLGWQGAALVQIGGCLALTTAFVCLAHKALLRGKKVQPSA